MKIAFVSDAIYPYNKGGKEKRLYDISTRLAQMGHEVHIYCMKWWKGSEKNRIENGVHLHAISAYYPLYSGDRRSIKEGVLFGLACLKLIREDWDVIDVDHMPFFPIIFTKIVCVLKGKKMVATWNEVWGKEYWNSYIGGVKGLIAYLIEKNSVSLPDKILSISPLTKDKLINTFSIPKEKIIYIPCGYDSRTIEKASASSLESDVIYVGRLLSHKNVDILIQAIGELKIKHPNIICRIVGVGPEDKKLHILRRNLNLEKNIVFHGELNKHSDVYALMKSSRVFVLPSTREGFGIVVLEANKCGLPVISIEHPDNAAKKISQLNVELKMKSLSLAIDKFLNYKNDINKEITMNLQKYDWEKLIIRIEKFYIENI